MPRKKNKSLLVRFDRQELEQVQDKVQKSGLSQQEYLRRCVLEKKITVIDGVRELTAQLGKIGSNVNQIARAVNAGMVYDCGRQVDSISKKLKEVWQILRLTLSDNQTERRS